MNLPFYACPECHKDFRAEVENPLQNVRCPHCKKVVHLPKKSAAKWFIARGKEKIGPLTLNQLQEYADKGELQRDTMLLKDGDGMWVRAGDFPLLFPEASATHAAAPRYSRRFMVVVASLVFALLMGGGWIVFSGPREPANGKQHGKKNGKGKNGGKPPLKKIIAPPPNIADIAKDAFRKIEGYRKEAGSPPVSYNMDLSEACEAHAKYLARNPDLPNKQLDNESPNRPGFSEKGKDAARWSFIFLNDPLAKIEDAMANTVMRTAFINPRLEKIGIGYAKSAKHGDILVIDAKRGEGDTIVVYPGPGQTDVPVVGVLQRFQARNDVVSFPITIQFPTHYRVSEPRASVSPNEWGQNYHYEVQGSAIVLYRTRPFVPRTEYGVKFQANVNGKTWKKEWRFTTGSDEKKTIGEPVNDVLAKINRYRRQAGLNPVSVDPQSSRGCAKHARYLITNVGRAETQGVRVRTEVHFLKESSREGHDAAQRSNIMLGRLSPVDTVDAWMASFYHRIGLLNPHLRSVGIGIDRANDRKTWATVVDVKQGRRINLQLGPVVYPTFGQLDVPPAFHEIGDVIHPIPFGQKFPVGFPITVQFPGNIRPVPEVATLFDANGKPVPCWVSYPGKPANIEYREHQEKTICIIPKKVLRPKSKYTVHVRASRPLKNWEKTWHFVTASNSEPIASQIQDDDPVTQTLAKINRFRKWAKLEPVSIDPRFAGGCQAHADYLQANIAGGGLGTKVLSSEYESKLKFTKEGRRAGSRAFIRIALKSPGAMIDELMQSPKLRPFILDPQWRYAGIGCALDPGRGWITVLDVLGDREFFVCYPGKDATDAPLLGRHIQPGAIVIQIPEFIAKPSHTGFPITFTFLQNATHPRIKLERRRGPDWEPVRYYDVEQSIANTVKIIPVAPLAPNTEYRVTLIVYFGDWDWAISPWRFRTTKE